MDAEGQQQYVSSSQGQFLPSTQYDEELQLQRQKYLAMKKADKQQLLKKKIQQYGQSSSDEDDFHRSSSPQSSFDKENIIKTQSKEMILQQIQSSQQKLNVVMYGKKNWFQSAITFRQSGNISITSYNYHMKGINKVKVIKDDEIKNHWKIKINYHEEYDILMAVSNTQMKFGMPLPYYIFAKIIQNRLRAYGILLKENFLEKTPGIPERMISKAKKYGKLYKKSQVLGNWEQRFIVLNKDSIFSYKKFNEKPTIIIAASAIKQLWTRFVIQEEMLTIKIKYGSKKTQFGIPLAQYLEVNSWLYHFYSLMLNS